MRPTPVQWLRYAYGGSLPAGLREWVLRDTTGPTWVTRHLVRSVVQLLPVVVLLVVLVPAGWPLKLGMAAGGLAVSAFYSAAFIKESTEHRLVKAGYEPGTGHRLREERAVERWEAARAAWDERQR